MTGRTTASLIRLVRRAAPAAVVVASALALTARHGEAHKPITSPFTYNDDVFPIVRDRCGRCHVPGGVAPMSLMTYKDAFPWGESIRTELVAGRMPPFAVDDAAGKFKNATALSARELNILLTWVTGGNPMGSADHTPPPMAPPTAWALGQPDGVVEMPSQFTMGPDVDESTQEFVLPVETTTRRLIRAVDLIPGNAAIVRSASVRVRTAGPAEASEVPDRILAVWVPGDMPVALENGAGFELPAGAQLVLRIHYKKTWQHERSVMTDRTRVGLYFAAAPAHEVRGIALAPAAGAGDVARGISFSHVVDTDVDAVAAYPDAALDHLRIAVRAVRPDGSHAELIRFRPHADWARRYWFATPVPLPRGTRIEVTAKIDDAILPPGAAPVRATPFDASAVRLTLDVIATR